MANIIITDVGLAALIDAQQSGTNALKLSKVQFGTGIYTPAKSRTALLNPIKTLTTIAGGAVGDNVIHVMANDDSSDAYTVYEVGVFTEDDILFAVYSQSTPILQKAAGSQALLALDFPVVAASDGDIVVEGTGTFTNPPGTTTTAGVVRLATVAETQSGESGLLAATPLGVKSAVQNAVPIGSGLAFFGNVVPPGYLLCNGAAVSRTVYAALFAAIGTLYGAGDGATTFNLPNCDGRVLQGTTDLTKVGVALDSQLPNISGTAFPHIDEGGLCWTTNFAGALKSGNEQATIIYGQRGSVLTQRSAGLYLNASFSSSVYGSYSRVQSPAIQVLTAIRYM